MKLFLLAELPLGIDFMQILYHVINFVILIVGVRFLFYKPIKKFMAKRGDRLEAQKIETEKLNTEARKKMEEYQTLMAESDKQIEEKKQAELAKAQDAAKVILSEAEQEGQAIRTRAKEQMELERVRMKKELKKEVADLALNIAGQILEREISDADNEALIDKSLTEWTQTKDGK